MQILSDSEMSHVTGGNVNPYHAGNTGGSLGGTWGQGNPGETAAAHRKYVSARNAWVAAHPNLDPEIFDSIYYRY